MTQEAGPALEEGESKSGQAVMQQDEHQVIDGKVLEGFHGRMETMRSRRRKNPLDSGEVGLNCFEILVQASHGLRGLKNFGLFCRVIKHGWKSTRKHWSPSENFFACMTLIRNGLLQNFTRMAIGEKK